MENNLGNGSRGWGRGGGGGGGRSRYRPYRWRGRGRGGTATSKEGNSAGSGHRFRNMMMPRPAPRASADRNVVDPPNWQFGRGIISDDSQDGEVTLPLPRKQLKLDTSVLTQLTTKYPGFQLYFSSAYSTIQNLLEKISLAMEYLKRHNFIPDMKTAILVKENEYFDINYDQVVADEEFVGSWESFDFDLRDNAEEVMKIWGISMHTLLHTFLTEDTKENYTDQPEGSDSKAALWSGGTRKSEVPYIVARLMKIAPILPIKSIRAAVVGQLVTIRGAVIRTGTVKPHCCQMTFRCTCCLKKFVTSQYEGRFSSPTSCPTRECRSKTFEALESDKMSTYTMSKSIRVQGIQQENGSERGSVPRSIECVLGKTFLGLCNAGDTVTLCGVVKHDRETGGFGTLEQQLHNFYIDVIAVRNHKDVDRTMGGNWFTFTEKDYSAVDEIADSENLFRLLVASLCPTIFGHDLVKAGLLLCLFGGSSTEKEFVVSRRSDINVLIVGDPGIGKSQMLSVVSEVAPRGVYVCGTATTVAGLTVTLVKDGDDYSLESGALVMADKGICCIDEFDKMQAQHHALLEAMEQQSISVAKSGVFRTLPARTSVIAAANPVGGHYNATKSVAENIRINPALLSRFDLTFILVDRSDEETDRNIVKHILGMRLPDSGRGQGQLPGSIRAARVGLDSDGDNLCLREKLKFEPNEEVDLIPHHLIRKYIAYARKYVAPTLSQEAADVIKKYYLMLRVKHRTVDAIPVTTRQLESLLRLTQARAKLELREIATEQDAKDVLEIFEFGMAGIFEDDLIAGTNLSQLVGTIGATPGGSRSQTKGMAKKLLAALQRQALQQSKNIFTLDEIKQIARALGTGTGIETLVSALNNEGFLLNKGGRVYKLQSAEF